MASVLGVALPDGIEWGVCVRAGARLLDGREASLAYAVLARFDDARRDEVLAVMRSLGDARRDEVLAVMRSLGGAIRAQSGSAMQAEPTRSNPSRA